MPAAAIVAQVVLDLDELLEGEDDDEVEMLKENMRNMRLSGSFLALARELDIMEPKTPEDVRKYISFISYIQERKKVGTTRVSP